MMKKQLNLPAAIRSFMGYLEGTEKAAHTIKSYQLDLFAFQDFLLDAKGLKRAHRLDALTRKDLEHYHARLSAQGLKANTRRRKLMTLRKFLSYLAARKKISVDLGKTLLVPHKIERIPFTLPFEALLATVRALPADTELLARNRVLLWTLIETGCLVSEVTRLRYDDYEISGPADAKVAFVKREVRTVQISRELFESIGSLRRIARNPAGSDANSNAWVYRGFNKFGPVGSSPMTPRGVELLVRSLALSLGSKKVTPRILRHSTVRYWLDSGLDRAEVQRRLGLKTAYAFRTIEPLLLKARSENSGPLV